MIINVFRVDAHHGFCLIFFYLTEGGGCSPLSPASYAYGSYLKKRNGINMRFLPTNTSENELFITYREQVNEKLTIEVFFIIPISFSLLVETITIFQLRSLVRPLPIHTFLLFAYSMQHGGIFTFWTKTNKMSDKCFHSNQKVVLWNSNVSYIASTFVSSEI